MFFFKFFRRSRRVPLVRKSLTFQEFRFFIPNVSKSRAPRTPAPPTFPTSQKGKASENERRDAPSQNTAGAERLRQICTKTPNGVSRRRAYYKRKIRRRQVAFLAKSEFFFTKFITACHLIDFQN
jgi:hypothetical protein